MIKLFNDRERAGVFRGFREGGLEFHADLTIPYRPNLHNIPMHGQFILVQLENPSEAVLGRITSISAMGRLTSDSGEQYSVRAAMEEWNIDDDLRESFLKYRVDIRVLGVIRVEGETVHFVPSHRRLPHVGSPVAFASDEVMKHLVGHHIADGANIGCFALGEYIYCGANADIDLKPWMQRREPEMQIRFPVRNLVSRRTVVFARAGFGKSNLNKLLFSVLYSGDPTVEKRNGRRVPVGTVIFDPDGEYFWPDDKGRPGFCDVPTLQDKVVVFTARAAPSSFYGSFVAGGVKLDIRRMKPADVISIALPPDKQDQQNVRKLRQIGEAKWSELVDLVHQHGNSADMARIQTLLNLEPTQEAEGLAARSNMTAIVRMLHDPRSQLMDMLMEALSQGKLCIVDVSQLRGGASLVLSGLILRRIFERNQTEFTAANPKMIPTIAVVEEAQSVLNDRGAAAEPYIEWVKEGRKYDLGAVLITQQPGSIPTEILSQADNWFLFHLLSESDLKSANRANAHFSVDLLSSLLNEPIEGQGVFWSSVSDIKYPVPLRILSFEKQFKVRDPEGTLGPVDCYASKLRSRIEMAVPQGPVPEETIKPGASTEAPEFEVEDQVATDPLRRMQAAAFEHLKNHPEFKTGLEKGIPWGKIMGILLAAIPETVDGRNDLAYHWVASALLRLVGEQNVAWKTERRGPKNTTFVVRAR